MEVGHSPRNDGSQFAARLFGTTRPNQPTVSATHSAAITATHKPTTTIANFPSDLASTAHYHANDCPLTNALANCATHVQSYESNTSSHHGLAHTATYLGTTHAFPYKNPQLAADHHPAPTATNFCNAYTVQRTHADTSAGTHAASDASSQAHVFDSVYAWHLPIALWRLFSLS